MRSHIYSVKILCALGLVWVQQSFHVPGSAEPLRHLTVLKDCNAARTRLFVTCVTCVALQFPLHWNIVWQLLPTGEIQSISQKLVNMSVCIQNAQLSPSVLWEAAWLYSCEKLKDTNWCRVCSPFHLWSQKFPKKKMCVCNCNCIICLRNPAADVQLRSLCPLFHCQEKLVSIVICRRCLSWQNEIIRWKLSQGVWVIIFRWTKGSGRLCNTCRFPEWVVGRFLFLIVLYRVWYLHLRVLQCLILPGVDMRL